jgi:hypothetical protein
MYSRGAIFLCLVQSFPRQLLFLYDVYFILTFDGDFTNHIGFRVYVLAAVYSEYPFFAELELENSNKDFQVRVIHKSQESTV